MGSHSVSTYLPLPTYLSTYVPTYIYLSIYLSIYLYAEVFCSSVCVCVCVCVCVDKRHDDEGILSSAVMRSRVNAGEI